MNKAADNFDASAAKLWAQNNSKQFLTQFIEQLELQEDFIADKKKYRLAIKYILDAMQNDEYAVNMILNFVSSNTLPQDS